MPTTYDELRALPGVGEYTASAIAAFAHGHRAVVLDTNVRRVLARVLAGTELPTPSVTRAERNRAEALLPAEPLLAARWSVAVMELRRPRLHRSGSGVRPLPAVGVVPVAGGRATRARGSTAAATGLGRDRPAVSGPTDGGAARPRGTGSPLAPGRRLDRPRPT
ncbi:MAG: hypothetical protein R2731_08920 [Nocardioides sp.]